MILVFEFSIPVWTPVIVVVVILSNDNGVEYLSLCSACPCSSSLSNGRIVTRCFFFFFLNFNSFHFPLFFSYFLALLCQELVPSCNLIQIVLCSEMNIYVTRPTLRKIASRTWKKCLMSNLGYGCEMAMSRLK